MRTRGSEAIAGHPVGVRMRNDNAFAGAVFAAVLEGVDPDELAGRFGFEDGHCCARRASWRTCGGCARADTTLDSWRRKAGSCRPGADDATCAGLRTAVSVRLKLNGAGAAICDDALESSGRTIEPQSCQL